ncbi:cupin domain-containing protein [Chryseobacterium sp. SIMBA_028]|uniref:cupin domain-containing protein n=1 Tax=Chryseobacterium sp. SIMBA_028 TaxID=3085771 RepID=UPI0039783AAF
MKYGLKYIFPMISLLFLTCSKEQETKDLQPKNSSVFSQGKKITNDNFTGTTYLQMLMEADSLNSISVGNVTFEPGSRSKWHIHPAGQILLGMDGVGYYQEKGQPKKILRKGDVIKCPPNTPHWHGASSDMPFVQVAITGREKGETVWLEPVTDEEYHQYFNKIP